MLSSLPVLIPEIFTQAYSLIKSNLKLLVTEGLYSLRKKITRFLSK